MDEYYRVPTLILLGLLVAVFAALYLRSRTQRRLLWLIGWALATLRLAVLAGEPGNGGFWKSVSDSCMVGAAAMFLGSLSPTVFGRRFRISYALPFSIPAIFFAVSTAFVPAPGTFLRLLNLLAVGAAILIAVRWSLPGTLLPRWFVITFTLTVGIPCLYFTYGGCPELVLRLGHSGISLLSAILVLAAYRRLTPGVLFTASGFLLWGLPLLMGALLAPSNAALTPAIHILNLIKVITAVGMIVLVLEDEARENESAQQRDRRARREMERYAQLDLSVEPQHDFGIQYNEICAAVVEAARFRQAAIYLFDVERNFRLAAGAGWGAAMHEALDTLGSRLSLDDLRLCWSTLRPEGHSSAAVAPVNLRSCLASASIPETALQELQHLSSVYTLPLAARSGGLQGVLLLAGLKEEAELLLPEDLLPLELLMARVAAVRENAMLARSITRSEKLAGIGRLAGGVAHELNNPLTVVMGYAELIQESTVEERIRRNAAIIHSESQRMKQIVESLARFCKPSPSPVLPIHLPELIAGVESLRRAEFEHHRIRFDVVMAAELPRILANHDQMRQILLQLLDTAAEAARDPRGHGEKRVRLEAIGIANHVQIVISDSGPGFPDPDKIFDPFFTIKPSGEGTALALSLCYSIIREQGGDVSAQNLQPYGAAVVLELPAEAAPESVPIPAHGLPA